MPFAFVTADTGKVLLMAALFVRGIGLGAAMIAPTGAAYVGLRHEEIPDASIITRVAQQIGGSVGIAVLAVVLERTAGDARAPGALAEGFDWLRRRLLVVGGLHRRRRPAVPAAAGPPRARGPRRQGSYRTEDLTAKGSGAMPDPFFS
ncbi:hypothetical protein ACFWDQ_29195 [Streptomyces sp. NPDC060053]|uniref:hypothetical protein n=1 Tax=Streptomyces sp. NPDC060053 TaxID=3347047 RepID=UPI00369212B1